MPKASKSKVSTLSASKSKASTSKTSKASNSKPLTSSGYRKIAMTGCVLFLKALVAPIEQFPFPRTTKAGIKRKPKQAFLFYSCCLLLEMKSSEVGWFSGRVSLKLDGSMKSSEVVG
ncbi:hypothetical protein Tco_1052985 [Tanacetum coccineum]